MLGSRGPRGAWTVREGLEGQGPGHGPGLQVCFGHISAVWLGPGA